MPTRAVQIALVPLGKTIPTSSPLDFSQQTGRFLFFSNSVVGSNRSVCGASGPQDDPAYIHFMPKDKRATVESVRFEF